MNKMGRSDMKTPARRPGFFLAIATLVAHELRIAVARALIEAGDRHLALLKRHEAAVGGAVTTGCGLPF